MKETKICAKCKKQFITYHKGKYCGYDCYWTARWGNKGKCKVCGKKARFRYCSDKCVRDFWNKNDYHLRKKQRNWEQKMKIIEQLGGKCKNCGFSDHRALDINHLDRNKKEIPKHRSYTWQRRLKDWKKNIKTIELLCANCHRIHTWEQMGYGKH